VKSFENEGGNLREREKEEEGKEMHSKCQTAVLSARLLFRDEW